MSAVDGNYMNNIASVEQAVTTVTDNLTNAETNLMTAYGITENDTDQIMALAANLGVDKKLQVGSDKPAVPTLRSLQLIAEQRFQQATHVMNMFTSILDKIDQLKGRIIQKFGQG
jgi:hypothetical protein